MMLFDSHAHLGSDDFVADADAVLVRAKEAGLVHIANIATSDVSLARGLALAKTHSILFNVGATTPHDVTTRGEAHFPIFEKAALSGQLKAVGETGLDYHYEHSPRDLQKDYFKRYMDLALRANLPLVIHCRDAFDDFFSMIDTHYKSSRGVLHCFTGTVDEAKEVIKRGWMLSLSGIVTFKKSDALREVAAFVPLTQLLIETDSPYLAPQSKRGQRCEPAFVEEVARVIANVKKLDVSEIASATCANAKRFFAL